MPTYVYRRPDGTTFELVQKFSDDALTTDPDTGVPVERVLSAPAIHFKGKGFHNTDYGTRSRNRELERSAKEGADNHDDKMASKRKEDAKKEGSSSSDSSSAGSSSSDSSSSSESSGSSKSSSTSSTPSSPSKSSSD